MATQRRPKPILLSWAIALLLLVVSMLPLIPPSPTRAPADTDFSVDRALDHIDRLAQTPRPMGSQGNERGRSEIAQELTNLGLSPQVQSIRVPNYFTRAGELVDVVNVMARIPGTDSTGAVVVMGHHDTVPTTLGANDNTTAVAILLEMARALLADAPLRNDVVLLFTDAEEPAPRYGSTAFVSDHPWADDVRFVINLEAIGSTGTPIVVEINGSTRWIGSLYARSTPYPAAYSFATTISGLVGGSNTDFATFRDAGISGVDVAYLAGSPIYHTMADTPDTVSRRTLYQHGANALALARSAGSLDLGEDHGDADGLFFTVGRFACIRIPASWSLPLLALTALLIIAAGWRRPCRVRPLLRTLLTLGVIAVAATVAALVWMALGQARSSMGLIESYLYLAAFAVLSALLAGVVAGLFRLRIQADQDALGVLLVWWALGLLTGLVAPGTSYLFIVPSFAGALLLLLRRPLESWRGAPILGWACLTGITLVLLVPAIDFFYQLAQPRPGNPDSEILPSIIIPIILVVLVFDLLRAFRRTAVPTSSF